MSKEKLQIDLIKDGQRPTVDIDLEESNTLEEMHERMLQSLQDYKFRDERIKEEWLRNVLKDALPPIKGKITKGKLKWRGIKLYIHTGARSSMYEVMQRGVRLGLLRVVDYQRVDFSRDIYYISDNPKHIPKDIQGVDFFATPVPTCSG